MSGQTPSSKFPHLWVGFLQEGVAATATSGVVLVCALVLGSRLCCRMPCCVTQSLHANSTTTIMNEMRGIKKLEYGFCYEGVDMIVNRLSRQKRHLEIMMHQYSNRLMTSRSPVDKASCVGVCSSDLPSLQLEHLRITRDQMRCPR
jgi:hypothetical protein